MTTAAWPTADRRLERRYRTLLLAYPVRYRRRHGTEMVTTLLEMAAAGQRRPGVAEALHLLGSGLRQRFRLPAGRPVAVVAAILVALTMGAFGAAVGSWVGAQTFADLPDDAAIASLAQWASGAEDSGSPVRSGSPWWGETVGTATEVDGGWDAEPARQRLAADGWSVSATTPRGAKASTVDPENGAVVDLPTRGSAFSVESGGLVFQVSGFVSAEHGMVFVDGWAQPTPAFLPLIVVGAALGLVAGWLIAAALAYRALTAPVERRRAAAGLWAAALLALALPAAALYGNLIRAFQHVGDSGPVFTVHSAFTPGQYYPFGPSWQILALSIAGAAVAAAAVPLARPGAEPEPEAAAVAG